MACISQVFTLQVLKTNLFLLVSKVYIGYNFIRVY